MNSQAIFAVIVVAFAISGLGVSSAQAAGGSSAPSVPAVQSPEQQAVDDYNRALGHRDKAWELEKKAATASGSEAEKLARKASSQYEKAAAALRSAIGANPRMHQAHGSLGYALRKLQQYEQALVAYDRALELNPGYSEAVEYRAEAYLALNRLEDAQDGYLELFRTDSARAAELMTAMRAWLASDAATTLDAGRVEAFTAWVEERAEIAEQVGSSSSGSSW